MVQLVHRTVMPSGRWEISRDPFRAEQVCPWLARPWPGFPWILNAWMGGNQKPQFEELVFGHYRSLLIMSDIRGVSIPYWTYYHYRLKDQASRMQQLPQRFPRCYRQRSDSRLLGDWMAPGSRRSALGVPSYQTHWDALSQRGGRLRQLSVTLWLRWHPERGLTHNMRDYQGKSGCHEDGNCPLQRLWYPWVG